MFHSAFTLLGVLLLVANEVWPCSVPTDMEYNPRTTSERTVLAPIVFEAEVVNTSAPASGPVFDKYTACVSVLRVFKREVEIPRELCFGSFGPDELCLVHVTIGVRYVFFLNRDLIARYDGPVPVSAIYASDDTVVAVQRGICGSAGSPGCRTYFSRNSL